MFCVQALRALAEGDQKVLLEQLEQQLQVFSIDSPAALEPSETPDKRWSDINSIQAPREHIRGVVTARRKEGYAVCFTDTCNSMARITDSISIQVCVLQPLCNINVQHDCQKRKHLVDTPSSMQLCRGVVDSHAIIRFVLFEPYLFKVCYWLSQLINRTRSRARLSASVSAWSRRSATAAWFVG